MGRIVQIAEASVSTNKQRKEDEEEWEKVKYSG